MIISQYGFEDILKHEQVNLDPSRIASQVVTGIGFIGAGTIILQKRMVRGLTTAAGIWVTSGIGMAIGAGMYWLGISAAVLTLVGLEVLSHLFKSIGMKSSLIEFSTSRADVVNHIRERFSSNEFLIVSYQMEQVNHDQGVTYQVIMVVKSRKKEGIDVLKVLQEFQNEMTLYRIE